jgi:hypothetical protein
VSTQSPAKYIDAFMVALAMWADENLYGHGEEDDRYETLCEEFAEAIGSAAYDTLMDRPVR